MQSVLEMRNTAHLLEVSSLILISKLMRLIEFKQVGLLYSDLFGPFDRPKIDDPNPDFRVVKKSPFLEHFLRDFYIFCMVAPILLPRIIFFLIFVLFLHCQSCQK